MMNQNSTLLHRDDMRSTNCERFLEGSSHITSESNWRLVTKLKNRDGQDEIVHGIIDGNNSLDSAE